MPFRAPWADYQVGDLLYGLADPCNDFANWLGVANLCTIDQYDIVAADRGNGLLADRDFYNALDVHPKYTEVSLMGDLDWDLSDDTKWQGGDRNTSLALAKRKCKGGLNWITRNTVRRIHFLLDGLNLVAAARKNYDGSLGGEADAPRGKSPNGTGVYAKVRSITGAELRWVYRNRRDPAVIRGVQFWRGKVSWGASGNTRTTTGYYQCPPPWSDIASSAQVRSAWAAYVPARIF